MRTLSNRIPRTPGAAPGIEHDEIASLPGGSGQAHITCLDYSPAHVSFLEVESLEDFVAVHRPEALRFELSRFLLRAGDARHHVAGGPESMRHRTSDVTRGSRQ